MADLGSTQTASAAPGQRVQISQVSSGSIALGLAAAIAFFAFAVVILSRLVELPVAWLLVPLFGPFAIFFLVTSLAHRRRFVFDERAGTLQVENRVFGFRWPAALTVSLDRIEDVQFDEVPNGEDFSGQIKFRVAQHGTYVVSGYSEGMRRRATRIMALVFRAKQSRGA